MIDEIVLSEAARSRRRFALGRSETLVGLDFVRVQPEGENLWTLLLHFVPSAGGAGKAAVPEGISPAHLRFVPQPGSDGGALRVEGVSVGRDAATLAVHVRRDRPAGPPDGASAAARYRVQLVGVPSVDRLFSTAHFTLAAESGEESAPIPFPSFAPAPAAQAQISYLAKDYASFRKLLLDRLALLEPGWRERNPADTGVMLVELLAYVADYLSYQQDAVATEAYLGTARRRTSLRRHARLLDYPVDEGCSALVLVQLRVVGEESVRLPRGTQLATGGKDHPTCVLLGSPEHEGLRRSRVEFFETLHDAELHPEHDRIRFYGWGGSDHVLPAGSTRATLLDGWTDPQRSRRRLARLRAGDVLIFEEEADGTEDVLGDGRPRRHAVRLTAVRPAVDPLGGLLTGSTDPQGIPVLGIEWADADALPFALHVAGLDVAEGSHALGNIVLADQGATVVEDLPPVPEALPYRPSLSLGAVAWTIPYTRGELETRPVTELLHRDPARTLPAVRVSGTDGEWTVRRDLFGSDRFARDFVVETDDQGRASLRFGDGMLGKRPAAGAHMAAAYRSGRGRGGNVGRGVIRHLVLRPDVLAALRGRVLEVWNPLSGHGGKDPESTESIRAHAPGAFHAQRRCVTEDDYAAVAREFEDVEQAVARVRWTGSWHTAFVYVQRRGARPVDEAFRARLLAYLERFRPAGHDLEVRGPDPVPLDIRLAVRVAAGHFRATVERSLLAAFCTTTLPGGTRGFFHPDNWTLGQPAYLSPMIAAAARIPGVAAVDALRFARWRSDGAGRVADEIRVGPTERIQVCNDPHQPASGHISFRLEGGE